MNTFEHVSHPLLNALLDVATHVSWHMHDDNIFASVRNLQTSKETQYQLYQLPLNATTRHLSNLITHLFSQYEDTTAFNVMENIGVSLSYEMWVSPLAQLFPNFPIGTNHRVRKVDEILDWDVNKKTALLGIVYFKIDEPEQVTAFAKDIGFDIDDVPFEMFEKVLPGSVARITQAFNLGLTSNEVLETCFNLSGSYYSEGEHSHGINQLPTDLSPL